MRNRKVTKDWTALQRRAAELREESARSNAAHRETIQMILDFVDYANEVHESRMRKDRNHGRRAKD